MCPVAQYFSSDSKFVFVKLLFLIHKNNTAFTYIRAMQ